MKKNWIFVILSITMLFSLSFLPASGNDLQNHSPRESAAQTQSTLAEISLSNPTQYKVQVLLWALADTPSYYVYIPPKAIKSIKVKPGSYWIDIKFSTDQCSPKGRNMKITKKTSLTMVCSKPK
jgi:hypothetical protein